MRFLRYCYIKANQIDTYFKNRKKVYEERIKKARNEFIQLCDKGYSGEIILPKRVLRKFVKSKTVKQVEKINQEIKKLNGLD